MTTNSSSEYPLLDQLAEEFADRYRRGERPSLKEYTDKYPHLAAEIRDLFPAMVEIEQVEEDRREPLEQAVAAAVPPMRSVGDYCIVREIGRGGMGTVYEAEQQSLGRRVALKILPANTAQDTKALERFRREARAAARLHHTNIVPIFEVGQEGEVCWYAMQLIQGQSLDQIVEELRRLRAHSQTGKGSLPADGSQAQEQRPPRTVAVGQLTQSLLLGKFEPRPLTVSTPCPSQHPEPAAAGGLTAGYVLSATDPEAASIYTSSSTSAVLPGQAEFARVEADHHHYFRSVARIGHQTATALSYAHARGIVHRDIKPSNLLLDGSGVVWVTDFGLAKTEDDGLTNTGEIPGTLRYMSPERFGGLCDVRADIYSLGLTLYEMLVLKPAFDARDRLRLIEQIREVEPARPRLIEPQIPRDLETIVLKASDKDPRRRYQSADDLAEDLRRFLGGEPILARQVSATERFTRWCSRNPMVATLTAAVAVALLLGTSVATFFGVRANENAAQARTNEELAEGNAREARENEGKARQEKSEADAARSLANRAREDAEIARYYAEMNLAGQAAESAGGIRRVKELLEHWRPTGGESDRRDWEWYYLRGLGQRSHLTLHRHTAPVRAVDWSPDGRRLASASEDGTIKIWDATTGRELASLPSQSRQLIFLAWSPDGRRLASVSGHERREEIRLWDPDTGQQTAVLRGHSGMVLALSWAPGGKRLVSTDSDQFVRLWDVENARQTDAFRGQTRDLVVSWSPDGRHIALAGNGPKILLRDTETKRHITLDTGHTGWIQALSWSPTGRILASGSNDSVIRLWDFDQKREVGVLRGHTGAVPALSWNRDGLRLASASGDQSVRVWDVKKQMETAILRGHTSAVRGVAWSPDGRRLASAGNDQTVRVWEIDTSPDNSILRGHTSSLTTVSWDPDGRRLASAGLDRTIRVWDADAGRQVAIFSGHTAAVGTLSWSPDGRRLASASDGALRLWDVVTGRGTALCNTQGNPVVAASWSPDGRRLASWDYDRGIKVWDTDSRQLLFTLPDNFDTFYALSALSWAPDGRRLASGSGDGTVRLWDVDSRRELACLSGHTGNLLAVNWSPDGQRLASAGADQTIKLWQVSTAQALFTLRGHSNAVNAVSWSPDRRLASASSDGTVKLWDTETGGETLTLRGPPGDVNSVSWSRDGRRLASAGMDGTVRIWDVTPGYAAERSPLLLPELDRRLSANPRGIADLELRAEIQARLGRWEQAAADWSRAAGLQGDKAPRWFQAGLWVSRAARLQDDKMPQWLQHPGQAPPLHWRAATTTADGCLDLAALWPQSKPGSAFALLRLYSPREQSITALMGGTGPLRFWHDDQLLYEAERGRPRESDEGVPLTLRAGWNTLLFKVGIGTGADRLYLRISANPEDRVRALSDRGRWDEATALLADTLKQQPNQPDVLLLAARLFKQHDERMRQQGRKAPAEQAERQARVFYEKLLALRPDHSGYAAEFAEFLLSRSGNWEVLEPAEMVSAGGTTLTQKPDGSILASGKNPWPETYKITSKTKLTGIRGVRLELLTDPSLPMRGPGRAPNGNIRLSEFRITAAPETNPVKARPVVLHNAWADYSENGFPVAHAVDGNRATAWAVNRETGQPHVALFEIKEAITNAGGTILTCTLEQHGEWTDHNLGRFRLSVTTQPQAVLDEKVRRHLATKETNAWTKLGGAHYLRGEWQSALGALKRGLVSPSGGTGYDRFLLSQIHARLGQHKEAQRWYDETVGWMAKNPADELLLELAIQNASERIEQQPKNAGLYLQRARWYAQLRQRPEALAGFARAVELDPALTPKQEDAQLLFWRGDVSASRGEWQKASADFAQVGGFPKTRAYARYVHSLVLLHLGDTAGYKKACAAMSERFALTEDPDILLWLARACVLTPAAVGNYDSLLRRLEKAVADTPRWCKFRHPLGAVLYRAGKPAAAIRRLNEAVELHSKTGLVSDWLFLAMAHHREGQMELARKWLDKAVRQIDQAAREKPRAGAADAPFAWINQVELQLLRGEAEALIKGAAPQPKE